MYMKKLFILCTALILLTGIYSCETVADDKTALCNNGIMDGGETEIDCGAACANCPDAPTISCIVGNSNFVASGSTHVYGQQLTPSIRVYGNNGNPLFFMFPPGELNQPLPVGAVSFAYNGEAYTMESGDSGKVVITAQDTLRKIISGTFWFTAGRVTGPDTTSVREGVFTNVRYNN